MKRLYYGFRYFSGKNTTTGRPNPKTGRHSIAGEAVVFEKKENLISWLKRQNRGGYSGRDGGIRERVTKSTLRWLLAGLTTDEFEESLCVSDDLLLGDCEL